MLSLLVSVTAIEIAYSGYNDTEYQRRQRYITFTVISMTAVFSFSNISCTIFGVLANILSKYGYVMVISHILKMTDYKECYIFRP